MLVKQASPLSKPVAFSSVTSSSATFHEQNCYFTHIFSEVFDAHTHIHNSQLTVNAKPAIVIEVKVQTS